MKRVLTFWLGSLVANIGGTHVSAQAPQARSTRMT